MLTIEINHETKPHRIGIHWCCNKHYEIMGMIYCSVLFRIDLNMEILILNFELNI